MNSKEIHVVAGVDNNYAQHLGVTFASLLANVPQETSVRLYIVHSGLSVDNQSKLESTFKRFGADIRFIAIDGALFERFPTTGHINRAMYLRLTIPEALPPTVSKVIYLDSDIVVTENIAELWDTELGDKAIAAVGDHFAEYRCSSLRIPEGRYFNSGVLVMNLTKWREQSLAKKVIDYISHYDAKLHFPDQDALNALLFDDWVEVPHKWNADTKKWEGQRPPAIIHYTDISKPWHFDNYHRYKNEYYKYLRMTEWRNYRQEVNWGVVGIRIIRLIKWSAKRFLPKKVIILMKRREIG
ncbi:glycosyltransferase family 8 protein [Cohnella endophytica]|uniref:Glycosyltransferase family 8 protein n=1 Tax=Cohnella endophytica TaxID=2419778 RepID=A0A494Y046_9BACL|nr:glycosyltransferase family 8 protein [Cohnella endophytica]RKP53193.1 glycosyltransferase family 8 protein [Cohnella endophytica]